MNDDVVAACLGLLDQVKGILSNLRAGVLLDMELHGPHDIGDVIRGPIVLLFLDA